MLCLQHTDDGRRSSPLISNDDSFCVDLNTKNVSERVRNINEKKKKVSCACIKGVLVSFGTELRAGTASKT